MQLRSSGWSWHNQGTTAEVDTIREQQLKRTESGSSMRQRAAWHTADCKWSYLDQKSHVQMLHVHVPWICSEASLVPRPTPIYSTHWCGRVARGNRKTWYYPSHDWCRSGGRVGPNHKWVYNWLTNFVWEFRLAVERSNRANWMMNCFRTCWNDYRPRSSYIHLTSTWRHSCDERQAFPVLCCSSTSAYYCQCKLMNRKRGRHGNKATLRHRRCYKLHR